WDEHAAMPSGRYTLYAWTPVVMGEQGAVAQHWHDMGFEDLADITDLSPSNPLMKDPRIAKYCSAPDPEDPFAEAAFVCATIPQEVWDAVLTRDVPVDTIVDVAPYIIISEP